MSKRGRRAGIPHSFVEYINGGDQSSADSWCAVEWVDELFRRAKSRRRRRSFFFVSDVWQHGVERGARVLSKDQFVWRHLHLRHLFHGGVVREGCRRKGEFTCVLFGFKVHGHHDGVGLSKRLGETVCLWVKRGGVAVACLLMTHNYRSQKAVKAVHRSVMRTSGVLWRKSLFPAKN